MDDGKEREMAEIHDRPDRQEVDGRIPREGDLGYCRMAGINPTSSMEPSR
jgi:hypothetical protein